MFVYLKCMFVNYFVAHLSEKLVYILLTSKSHINKKLVVNDVLAV